MQEKIRRLQKVMREKKIGLSIFMDLSFQKKDPNLRYFIGADFEYFCLAVPQKGKAFLVVPGFEFERAKKLLGSKIRIVRPKIKRGLIDAVFKTLGSRARKIRKIGITGSIFSFNETKALRKRFRKVKIVDLTRELLKIRQIKTDEEIRLISKAAVIASDIVDECFSRFKSFKREEEVQGFLKKRTLERGCELAFEPIVATGKNASFAHHNPFGKINKGFGYIDFGVKYKGYCSDITREFYIGKPSKKEINLYNMMLSTQENAIKGIKEMKSFEELDKKVRALLGKQHFTHGLGHGIGVEIHEFPNVPSSKEKAQSGMIFTIEPGYYIKDRLGIRIEEDILISGGKTIILTKISKKLRIFV